MTKRKRKIKSPFVRLRCLCGYGFTAIFSKGKLPKLTTCQSCGRSIRTDGKPQDISKEPRCLSCRRPDWLNFETGSCKFCGFVTGMTPKVPKRLDVYRGLPVSLSGLMNDSADASVIESTTTISAKP